MNNDHFLYIANWKNYFTLNQATNWLSSHEKALATLANDYSIIICPPFEALSSTAMILQETNVKLGAQNCSAHGQGAFTGQVLVESLAQIGCSYCIIGHPEVQRICPENAMALASKAIKLMELCITPILCVGESAQDYELSQGQMRLEEVLIPFFESIANKKFTQKKLCVAYEPIWAINSSSTPPTTYIEQQLAHIEKLCLEYLPALECLKLYGGGIDETNIRNFKNMDGIDGFLIGRASTDFQKFQKIVIL